MSTENTNEKVEQIIESPEIEGLKVVLSNGFSVSGEYSSRKIDSRTSIECPLTVNLDIIFSLKNIQQISNIHDSAISGFESKFLEESDFYNLMIPTLFNLSETKQKIKNVETLKAEGKLTPEDLFYLTLVGYMYKEAVAKIKAFDVQEKARELTNASN